MNDELRAIAKNQRNFDSAVMMSSLIPSENTPAPVDAHIVERRYSYCRPVGQRNPNSVVLRLRRCGLCVAWPVHGADEANPLAWNDADEPLFLAVVADRISSSVIRLSSVESETIRPPHTSAMRSSRLTT